MSETSESQTNETIVRDDQQGRYVLTVDGTEVGHIEFHDDGQVIDMPHTVVEPAHEGKGYAGKLARFAMDDARAQGRRVKPTCPYLDRWLTKHNEYEDLRA